MSFKKHTSTKRPNIELPRGFRTSPLSSQTITSSGSESLDYYLLGGIPSKSLIVIEEQGTTDYASVFLKTYAAEGLLQGHAVWLGPNIGPAWFRTLPDQHSKPSRTVKHPDNQSPRTTDSMKIAWRYQSLKKAEKKFVENVPDGFTHSFSFTKHLPLSTEMKFAASRLPFESGSNPYAVVLQDLSQFLSQLPSGSVCRLVLPSLLSPAFYPIHASKPMHFVRFIHSLLALIKCTTSIHLTCMCSVPITLFSRDCEQTFWLENLASCAISLHPFEVKQEHERDPTDKTQGLLKIHKLPLPLPFTEKPNTDEAGDLAFTMSKRHITIEPWVLPPIVDNQEQKKTNKNIDF
ncbi:elongator complex subunit Elp4 [Schizosaccharomyces japonicus yFS275]|uniref:Elongator complex protein 4 n=1 Tax=Schizosaccharomyces japonicus (strain yFS275 / FY16936) TaxID=402676 RepID=B6K4W3_SCHJY|nr:elongator complex subunit Elp4 [Schizosaccharomyces japonicus yFS275]EEB08520.1 elongator complex subunit Elp4 [Schizosaccharomyces japonicus yFS275]